MFRKINFQENFFNDCIRKHNLCLNKNGDIMAIIGDKLTSIRQENEYMHVL